MKALVLGGGIPQIALVQELKARGIFTLMADANKNVAGQKFSDAFFPISILDTSAIRNLAIIEKVDFIITVCADQVLEVVAQVSEELGLPCYIDSLTSSRVSNKSLMKQIFLENKIPTSQYIVLTEFNKNSIQILDYPLIVKPTDSYSSRGVRKVYSYDGLETAFYNAMNLSRSKMVIVEEFVQGAELTVDAYVEEGKSHILCVSSIDKIYDDGQFVINRTRYPACVSEEIYSQIEHVAQLIANSFKLMNSPMLIQLINDDSKISVIEFCARTGGGEKFRLIKKVVGFDVVKAVADLTLGQRPHFEKTCNNYNHIVNEFLYCLPGVFHHLEGFEELVADGTITEYYQLKQSGTVFDTVKSSGDRVAYYSVEANNFDELKERYSTINKKIKAIDMCGSDILRHDLIEKFIVSL